MSYKQIQALEGGLEADFFVFDYIYIGRGGGGISLF